MASVATISTPVPASWAESSLMARPWPYSLLSWTMAMRLPENSVVRYFTRPWAWAWSLASTRWNTFPPGMRSWSVELVAEALTMTRPFSSSVGSTARVSPEKAGPTMPRISSSLT